MNHRIKFKWNTDAVLWSLLWKDIAEMTLSIFSNNNNTILDVGCGSSSIFIQLKQFQERIIGIDIDNEIIKLSPYQNILASAHNLPFRREIFDGIHCRGVIHHLNIDLLFSELLYVSKDKSRIFVLEPLKGVINRLIRFFITTDIHDPNELPLSSYDIRKIGAYIKVIERKYLFWEFSYQLPFILPLLPKVFNKITRRIVLLLNLMHKRFQPFAYIRIVGALRAPTQE